MVAGILRSMTTSRLDLVRSITDGFSEIDFAAFRDALTEADSMEDVAASVGPFGELLRDVIDPDVEIGLYGIRLTSLVGERFHGWKGWLDFWRGWLEPWSVYETRFSDPAEIGDAVLLTLDVETRGRGSGVEVRDQITTAWTVHEGKVTRLDMYASRRRALADLDRG
jgi:hypothetical protein